MSNKDPPPAYHPAPGQTGYGPPPGGQGPFNQGYNMPPQHPGNYPPPQYPGTYPPPQQPGPYGPPPGDPAYPPPSNPAQVWHTQAQPQSYATSHVVSSNNTVVITQPTMAATVIQPIGVQQHKHRYMPLAIFVTICCNCPIGIVAIIFAAVADGNPSTDTYNMVSLITSIIALVCGICAWIYIVYYIVAIALLFT